MVDGHGRHATPVVDPGVEQEREVVVGEVRRRLDVDTSRRERSGRRRSTRGAPPSSRRDGRTSACRPSRGSSGRSPRGDARAPPRSSAARGARRSRSPRVSPIPTRIPLVNGIESSPARRIVSSRRAGSLSGEAQCGPPRAASRSAVVSSMIPIDAATARSAASSSRVITPGFRCGKRPVSSSTRRRAAREILERRATAERGKLFACYSVARLGAVAEGEERLGAAGLRPRSRDREHLVLGEVGARAAPRRPREGAVAADVAAERRQRHEDLRRVRDERPRARGAQAPRLGHEVVEGRREKLGGEVCHRRSVVAGRSPRAGAVSIRNRRHGRIKR